MATFKYSDFAGIIRVDTDDVVEQVIDEFKQSLGSDINTDISSFEGRLIEAETSARINTAEALANLANQINPDLATGVYLDAVCSLVGVKRNKATFSTVTITISGTANTAVPVGFKVSDGKNEWINLEQVAIASNGTVDTQCQCADAGAISAKELTITKIVKPHPGIDSVTNKSAAIPGKEYETDYSLRNRRIKFIASNARSNSLSVIASIGRVKGVNDISFAENTSGEEATVKGVTLKPHSTYVCVEGGLDTDIASAYQVKSAGCDYTGKHIVKWRDPYSKQDIDVRFDRPTYTPVQVEVTVSGLPPASVDDSIKQAIVDYSKESSDRSNGFNIGVDLSTFQISNALHDTLPFIFITSIKICLKGGTLSTDTIKNNLDKKCTVDINDIAVVYKQ